MLPPSSAIPKLNLTPEEQQVAADEVAAVLAETLEIEREFLAESGPLDKRQWKEVKSRDDFRVFKERRRVRGTGATTSGPQPLLPGIDIEDSRVTKTRSTISSAGDGVVSSIKEPHVPMIVAAGHLEGQIEDVIYGSVAGDEISWRLRTTYMKDKFADAKIVATIKEPTRENPYDYLAIKWFVREHPPMLSLFVQPRDFLVIEATGYTVDKYGQRHGYYIIHEFHHPALPELKELGVYRCKMSLCFISRQVNPSKVHIFARGFVDPKGDLAHGVTVALTAEAMLSTAHCCDSSYAKKLTWLMSKHRLQRQQQRQQQQLVESASCQSCQKTSGFLKASLTTCHLCGCIFCSRCTVQRKIIIDVSTGGVTERSFPFCHGCILRAKQQSPYDVAVDQVTQIASLSASFVSRPKTMSVASSTDSRYGITVSRPPLRPGPSPPMEIGSILS
ncbi:hypothetical protein Poli38472_012602 [Pythium oligandrum]|uniref:FYVE-type domain-containing protein n=1 Tax=Pythium oligandrum TaxID=41045 RepID=A0A8K1FG97_PYTOL|nr:hypothetical protein Poli38472_012602 [Pythium oligandrum]|eukprot:TMW61411.1 hypothetical protein Poli38472_012602 [Pythium oligandrum]